MKVLVACEYSGRVREAFAALGHDAWSCDVLDTEQPGQHIIGDVLNVIDDGWDLMVAHPPCTYLCNSGVRWLFDEPGRRDSLKAAAEFFGQLWNAPVERIAIENPIMHGHARRLVGREATQIIHPWEHGHGESKATCLWLKNLPPLRPSKVMQEREQRLHRLPPSENRWKERSRTFEGIAAAMADQWGGELAPYQMELIA